MLNLNTSQTQARATLEDGNVNLQSEVAYRTRLIEIGNKINAARDLDEIFIDLSDEILSLFDAERLTVYVVDGVKRELVSRFKSGDEIGEIRIPVSKSSLAGYAALTHKLLNIGNVYDKAELQNIDENLDFDKSWDQKTGFRTQQVLVYPIIFQKYLMGALQLINRKDGGRFHEADEKAVVDLAKIIGIALYNQKRMAARGGRVTKFDYLLENHLVTQKELAKAITDARQRKEPVESVLSREYKVPKTEIGESLSRYYKVPFVSYSAAHPIPGELLAGIKVPFMRANLWVPLRLDEGQPVIAIDDPHDLKRIDEIKALFPGRRLKFAVTLKQDILDFIKLFSADEREMAEIDDILSQLQDEYHEIEEAESGVGEEDSAVVQLVNKIILDAYARNASDIHIEPYPGKQNTMVRIRVDGSCTVYQTVPFAYRNAVVSRIKIMADLDIAERRLPQDGKIKFKKYGGKDIELRVATIPTQGGMEDVVMRILAAGEPIPLDKIGFSERNYDNFVQCVIQPYGLVLVCGPTGSGKTTTLHSALAYINKTETKIWTAEDPVEITQKGLRQVQVKPKIGFTFAAAMRSFLRADPDVIMVGEMRDKETTHIGIEASLTGHLVFSTLHTNTAPESIVRLLDMGMDPFNFADAILCIMAQRLVRTLCPDCKKAYNPSEEEFGELVREYGEEEFAKNVNINYNDELELYKPQGCEFCNNTGYRGRMGIHELLVGTEEMKKLVQRRAQMEEIRRQAIADGMTTLKQDGIEKIFGGKTDMLQVRKVCIK
ncbi:GspE/PulE family protein [Desulfatitalea alkaliphila]|uniref:GspE/PulE family protein n=1 Tax=Desulfatitalea alkaliphila TaxID=2929485 RepID=A0AA41R1M9_9BACT|nr:GspE/PulE family protein [Desulfatitalea alkaliphila]MCJ8500497.1 GspE/PulE family protein [Desulfatitalea alkaliphila]